MTNETNSYTAEFTDVSGLGAHGDIRTKGVRIGKVESVELIRDGGRSLAEVHFTMEKPYQLTSDTILAVKYQNLTGVRYIDAEFPENPGGAVDRLPADKTRASFDITELFNGLQPVLATMSTDDINTFTENAISLLQGDGNGLSPMLEDAQKLAGLAHDREQVISTLTGNLARISDSMGGRSPEVVEFLRFGEFPDREGYDGYRRVPEDGCVRPRIPHTDPTVDRCSRSATGNGRRADALRRIRIGAGHRGSVATAAGRLRRSAGSADRRGRPGRYPVHERCGAATHRRRGSAERE